MNAQANETVLPPGPGGLAALAQGIGPGLNLLLDETGEATHGLLQALAAAERERCVGRVERVFWRDPRAPWPELSPAQWAQEQAARHPGWSARDWATLVRRLALTEHVDKTMFRLSTGSQRKVLLAAALASGAPLTLIDEPEAALDRASIGALRQALAERAPRCVTDGRAIVVGHWERMPEVPWTRVARVG